MTAARAIEYRITRELLKHRQDSDLPGPSPHVERLIAVLAVAGGLLLFGSLLPELVAAAVAGSLVWALAGN